MKKCENCNSEILNEQVYCNKCGHKNNPSLLDNHVSAILDLGDGLKVPTNPITFEYCYQIGASAMVENNYYEALEYFNYAISFQDVDMVKLSQIYCDIGTIYWLTVKAYDKSVGYYELAISSNPKNEQAYMNLMSIKVSKDDNGALEDFKRMVDVIPTDNPHCWYLAGLSCENLHRYEAAQKFYKEAIKRGYHEAQADLNDIIRKIKRQTT